MSKSEPNVNSADSVSWRATREAEKLSDFSVVPELEAYLRERPIKGKRAAAYFIIGKIGKNCQSAECATILIGQIGLERDKYALAGLLDRLADIPKPEELDLAPVYGLLHDKRWLVRHAAIRSLINSASLEAEERVLEVLRHSTDPHDTICCHATLNHIGTDRAVPILEAGLKSRKRDVKLSAKAAIEAIAARSAAQQHVSEEAPSSARR